MIARHDQLLDVLYEAASGASLAPVREERHLLPGSAARPGDLLIRRWADGKDAAIDVTVTVPLARFNVAAAADEAFNRKVQGTAQACQDQGIAFFPGPGDRFLSCCSGNAGKRWEASTGWPLSR